MLLRGSNTCGTFCAGATSLVALIGGALLAGIALSGCGSSPAQQEPGKLPETHVGQAGEPLTKVTLALNWFPESEHGGYYAAQVRGYYREAGLEVTIQSGGPSAHMLEQVAAGRATFGVANADNILFARAEQAPVVALMAPLQSSPRCIMVHKSSGIETFDQLRDVTLAMTPGAAFAAFLQWKLPLPGVRVVPYSGSVQPFLVEPRYAQQAYIFSEPFLARQQGADPGVLLVSDLGFNPYTSLLFTTDTLVEKEPEIVRRMVAASVRGWQDYLQDPEPTNRHIQELNPVVDLESLAFAARQIAPLIVAGDEHERGLGTMTPERWQTLLDQLVESGQLTAGSVEPRQAFTTDFLSESKPESPASH
jgi:NitT/TauT family transport system substrate-binding protein